MGKGEFAYAANEATEANGRFSLRKSQVMAKIADGWAEDVRKEVDKRDLGGAIYKFQMAEHHFG